MPETQNFRAELSGCFGQPVDENPSGVMMEAAYQHHGLPWRYITMEVSPENLADAVAGVKALGFQGFNCTIPHKIAVIEHLDGLGESAAVMGAVNCVVKRDGKFIGENTDGKGFVTGLKEIADPAGQRAVIFGAGGAARAIAVEMALAGAAHLTVVNRTPEKGATLADLVSQKTPAEATAAPWVSDYVIPEGTNVVINATSIGLFPDLDARLAIDTTSLKSGMVVADVIPNPPETHLVRDARAAGCHVIDGLAMLVNQGTIGIEYWTGVDPDPAVMRKALEEVFA